MNPFVRTLCAFIVVTASVQATDIFETPPVLRDNVEFWKKIYTDVSLSEGLIHDFAYPALVYRRMTVASEVPAVRSKAIDAVKAELSAAIVAIRTKPRGEWPAGADTIYNRLIALGGQAALDSAEFRIRFQRGQKERFKLGLYRSGFYLDSIKAIMRANGVPEQLAYLPHVESSFNYEAYSKVGAAGIWQFMRTTGKYYLKVNYDIDERRDPINASYAAAKFLTHNYKLLGSWPLAITAWNHGPNGMKRAVNKLGTTDINQIILRHESPSFKFASKNFYGCFLAALQIAQEPQKYFPDVNFAKPISYKTLVLPSPMRPSEIVTYTGVQLPTIKEMNLAIRPAVFAQNKKLPAGLAIHLPKGTSPDQIAAALTRVPAAMELKVDKTDSAAKEAAIASGATARYHTVRKGETLSEIARKTGIPLPLLVKENSLSRKNTVYAGQALRLPDLTSATTQQIPEPSITATAAAVQIRDTLADVAKTPAVSPVGAAGNVTTSRFDADIYDLGSEWENGTKMVLIRVSYDETIGHIADWADISQPKLRQANRLSANAMPRTGQKMRIPIPSEKMAAFNAARLEYHMGIEEDFYGSYRIASIKQRTIGKGESLWKLCNDADIPMWVLKKLNTERHLETVNPGTTLFVPEIVELTDAEKLARAADPDSVAMPLVPVPAGAFVPAP